MDRNISEQLNKAFEAYREASIEKDKMMEELRLKTKEFECRTERLEKKIEEQEKTISRLKAQLTSVQQQPIVENVGESSSVDHGSQPVSSCRTRHFPMNKPSEIPALTATPAGGGKNDDMTNALQEIQGTFRRIQTLSHRQKDQLRRIQRGNESTNEQISMPIQCTEDTAPQAQSQKPGPPDPTTSASLASRGAAPDLSLFSSLVGLSVKYPPNTDDEYDFLNSAPDKREEALESEESYLSFPSAAAPGVRGPQQVFWTPGASLGPSGTASSAAEKCSFCEDDVPTNHMYQHLNSHFKSSAD